MKDIIVDVKMHFPSLQKCIGNCDYFSSNKYGYLSKNDFHDLYGQSFFDFYLDSDNFESEYDNFYLVHHFVDINSPQTRWMDSYQSNNLTKNGDGLEVAVIKEIYESVKPRVKGKVIFLCTSDHPKLDLDSDGEYSFVRKYGLEYDAFFKKEYNLKAQYSTKTFPCPYFVMGSPDVLWMVNESILDNTARDDKVFWSGALDSTKYDYQLVNIKRSEYVNGFDKIVKYQYSGSDRGGLRDNNYLLEMSKHKYAIYLSGWATFTRRFFEIISTNTLVLFENSDINFGIDEFLHPLCIFNNLEELKENYNFLNSSNEVYEECLNHQKKLVQKYFNYEYVCDYIKLNTEK
jgi:hypothetical protein